MTGLSISANWKSNSYDSILVIVDQLTKLVYYKPVQVTINILGIGKVIIDVVVCHHKIPVSIVMD